MTQTNSDTLSKIYGSIYDLKGKAISGAQVKCNGRHTHTLFDGTYRFDNLVTSTYIVTVQQKGFQRQKKTIECKNKDVVLNFNLIPEEGTGKIHGYVIDINTKKPIGGGTMILVLPSANKQVSISPKNGYFQFANLPSGTHHIWSSILKYKDESKRIHLKKKEEKRVDFFCRREEAIEPPWG